MRLAALTDHWRNRPAHERWLIGVPTLALIGAIAWLGIIEPLSGITARLVRALPGIEANQARIRAQAADVRAHPVASGAVVARSGNPSAIITVAQAAIERHRLRGAMPVLERADDARVRLAFARVPFHSVWPLLQDLQAQSGIRVVALRIDRIDASLVRVDATLVTGERR